MDPSRYLAAECTRRAGKSNGLAYRFFRAALKYPASLSPYVALTRRSAYNIMWPIFKQVAREQKIDAHFTKSDLTITLPNEAQIQLFGADTENLIDRLRGPKYPFAAVDEAQSFKELINELVDDVLTPAIGDYDDGALAITGTPGPVASGFFYNICQGKMGFSLHQWSWKDNPYLKNYAAFVADIKKRRGWDDEHPTYRREWLGLWVNDPEARVYKFNREKNGRIRELPKGHHWFYVLGVDLGYSPDPSAFVLCAYSLTDPRLFIIDTYKKTEMIVSDVAAKIKSYLKDHPQLKIVIDAGGQGKQIAEEIRKRHQIPLHAAEKQGKSGFIEIMNSDFMTGKIQVLESCVEDISAEYQDLIWDAAAKDRKEDGRFPNHLTDSALYAWRYCYNYAWKARSEKPKPHTQEYIDEWERKESRRIIQEKREQEQEALDLFGMELG